MQDIQGRILPFCGQTEKKFPSLNTSFIYFTAKQTNHKTSALILTFPRVIKTTYGHLAPWLSMEKQDMQDIQGRILPFCGQTEKKFPSLTLSGPDPLFLPGPGNFLSVRLLLSFLSGFSFLKL